MRLPQYGGLVCFLALVTLFPSELMSQAAVHAETWVGGIASNGFISVRINVRSTSTGRSATIDFTNQGPERQALPLEAFSFEGARLRAEWTDVDGKAVLEGNVTAGRAGDSPTIEGAFTQGSRRGTFHLVRGSHVSRESVARWFGLYQLEPGHLLWLGEVSELSRRPAFIDAKTGRFGALYSAHSDTLFSGPTALHPSPETFRAAIALRDWPSGNTRSLHWSAGGTPPVLAKRLDVFTTEEVTFFNDTVRLTGTLVLPTTKGPHPAVVFIHGSGGGTRSYFSSLPFLLAAKGVASLVYDKRGSGGSSGNRHVSPFEQLADDALAGVKLLQSRADIAGRRIGLYGHSQGGWVAPLAASRSKGAVAFVVAVAGPAKDYEHQTNDEIENVMREYGMTEAEIRQGLDHQKLWWRVYRREAPYSELVSANTAAQGQRWSRYVFKGAKLPPDTTLDPPGAYDPEPVLRKLQVPMLAIYGGRDNRVLAADNARLMETFLRSAGNRDFTVKVFPTGNHDMIEVGDWPTTDGLKSRNYVDGYFQYLVAFIVDRAFKID